MRRDSAGSATPLISPGANTQPRSTISQRLVHLDAQPYTVVGVLVDPAMYPDRQTRAIVPYSVPPATGNHLAMFSAIALLRPAITTQQAAAEGTARGRFAVDTGLTTVAIFGGDGPIGVTAQPLRKALTADVRQPLVVLLLGVVLLLVTATANVASLQLARATTRARELAIRVTLGASLRRVMRQLVVVVGMIGGAAGLALAWLLHRAIPSLLPADFPRLDDLSVGAVVVTFAVVVSIGTSVLLGMVPALVVRRMNLVEQLAENGTTLMVGGERSRTARARMVIMAGQVAIACVLLVGAMLLWRSFLALLNADRGYNPTNVLSARLSMPEGIYPSPERRFALVEQILERLARVPGVIDAAFTSELPLMPGGSTSAFTMKSRDPARGIIHVQAAPRVVSPRYFSALGMRIIQGRGFSQRDTETSQPGVIVNRAFARQYLDRSPLGLMLPLAGYGSRDEEPIESSVIGVIDDVRYIQAGGSRPEMYYSHRQMGGRLPVQTVTLLARVSGDPTASAGALRSIVRDADQKLVAEAVMPLDARLLTTLARPRLYALLLGGFAGFALIIAAVGLFGALSYSVSQRSRELAIRTALGARRADILRLVLRQGLTVMFAGLVAGAAASTWLTRLLSAELYGVTPHDIVTFVLVSLIVVVVGTLACVMPARRAANLDPLRVMRGE